MTEITNDLFSIEELTHENGVIKVSLGINADCEILKGHFPGHPVVPGACMLQIIKEVLESVLQIQLRLKKADQLKFMTMIDPETTSRVELDITYKQTEENSVTVTANLSNPDTVYFKLKGSFVKL
ncbi:MAG: 3-hydroxyacyl-ACP dehydratase [Bacteroidetes bacterium]|jgi:3-hydroxyacyl-[acyl-carrier-protein] dehydratase|nr:3-hydroxyacyl-ACP dehydratase [Bacteroidota bacterium]